MTGHKLARILLELPDLRVMVDGYEYGLEDLLEKNVRIAQVVIDDNKGNSHCGPHSEWRGQNDPLETVIILSREG